MSFSETIFLFFLALVIFGPKKLPEIARQVGKVLNEFRRASNEFKAQIEQEISHLEVENTSKILPASPTPEGTASRTLAAPPETSEQVGPAESTPTESTPESLSTEVPPAEVPATLASSAAEPAATNPEPATEALPGSGPVTSSTTQESHA